MTRAELERLTKAELIDLVLSQAAQTEQLVQRLLELEERFAEQERRSHRGSAPFSRPEDKRKKKRDKPGRKGGHKGAHKARPSDDEITNHIEVLLETCPHCGERLPPETARRLEQTIIEPPAAKPEMTRLVTWRNHCRQCGEKVASSHPLQVSTAGGAAGTHLGPQALGVAASLNKELGLTTRKTCEVMAKLLGLDITPGGVSQAQARIAARMKAEYDALLGTVKSRTALHTDETSWYVGDPGHSLWVLTNEAGTYYRIVPSRTKAAAIELLGDYKGVLVSDCLNLYDNLTPVQHKCYAHHLKVIGAALDGPTARGSPYLRDVKSLLQAAMVLGQERESLAPEQMQKMREGLEANADRLLGTPRVAENRSDPVAVACAMAEEKVRLRLAKQRDHLFTFLDHDGVDATNNLAERQLRPAVISRKLSCGNKTREGADVWEILASLAATARQKGDNFSARVATAMTLKNQIQNASR